MYLEVGTTSKYIYILIGYHKLMVELKVEDPAAFQNFVRFEPAMFQEVVDRLTPLITKTDTNCHKALNQGLKLAITPIDTWQPVTALKIYRMASKWLTIPFVGTL